MNYLDDLIIFVTKNIWNILNFIGFIIGLFGLIFFFIYNKRKLPYYTIHSINLIKNLENIISQLQITFDGKDITHLTSSKIAFWNGGKDTINSIDIARADPIKFTLKEDYKILGDPIIILNNNPSNQFSITKSSDNKFFILDFEFVDKKDMVIIQLFHTGTGIDDFNISGTIKGVGSPKKVIKFKKMTWFDVIWSSLMLFLFYLLGYNVAIDIIKNQIPKGHYIFAILLSIFMGLILIFVTVLSIANIRYVFTKPKGFDVFERDFIY